jgi:FAD-dependent urate hydroxylase
MHRDTNLLIIGAGPFGLTVSAQASTHGIEHLLVGKPMEFWQRNMPKGMYLRSGCDWHLDPLNLHTIERFLQCLGKKASDVEPLSMEFYLSYVEWFQQQKQIQSLPHHVSRLDYSASDNNFVAFCDGRMIAARHVVIAPGFKYFAHVPEELKVLLPEGRFSHTCDFADFSTVAGKRYLIVGGRQSAFEWAALLIEAGASAVDLTHRHVSPTFATSDWSWVTPLVDGMVESPNWFRRLTPDERSAIIKRMWAEGRLKLEPWLESRLKNDRVTVRPQTQLRRCLVQGSGDLRVELTNGDTLVVDHVILATGYKVDIARVPFLSSGNVLGQVATSNGFPILDDHFQTSVPGLYMTSMPATQDFGPFFAFTVSVRASAKLICRSIRHRQSDPDDDARA